MGCWNGTCGLTGLPIFEGDDVRAVILHRSPYTRDRTEEGTAGEDWASGYCYINDVWHPRTIGIRAKYDDYGGVYGIAGISPLHEGVIRRGLRADLKPEQAGLAERPLQEILLEFARATVDLYDLNFKCHGHGHTEADRRLLPAGLWMCHEGAFQAATRAVTTWDGKTLETILGLVSVFPAEARDVAEIAADTKRLARERGDWAALNHTFTSWRFEGFGGWLHKTLSMARSYEYYATFVVEQLAAGVEISDEDMLALFYEVAEFAALNLAMSYGRIGWMPQTGAGSQNEDMAVRCALAQFTIDHAAAMEAKWAQEDAESEA